MKISFVPEVICYPFSLVVLIIVWHSHFDSGRPWLLPLYPELRHVSLPYPQHSHVIPEYCQVSRSALNRVRSVCPNLATSGRSFRRTQAVRHSSLHQRLAWSLAAALRGDAAARPATTAAVRGRCPAASEAAADGEDSAAVTRGRDGPGRCSGMLCVLVFFLFCFFLVYGCYTGSLGR